MRSEALNTGLKASTAKHFVDRIACDGLRDDNVTRLAHRAEKFETPSFAADAEKYQTWIEG